LLHCICLQHRFSHQFYGIAALVWRFRSPHHSCGEPDCGLLNQSHTRIKDLLVGASRLQIRRQRWSAQVTEPLMGCTRVPYNIWAAPAPAECSGTGEAAMVARVRLKDSIEHQVRVHRVRVRLNDPIEHRLRELGCTEQQIQRHLNRGKMAPIVPHFRPWPGSWRSWASRIMNRSDVSPERNPPP
jgi:hypothetical protein